MISFYVESFKKLIDEKNRLGVANIWGWVGEMGGG